jgi:hypothetical protein
LAKRRSSRHWLGSQSALGRRDSLNPSIWLNRFAKRASKCLELSLGNVVWVAAGKNLNVHGDCSVCNNCLKSVAHHRPGEVAANQVVLKTGRFASVNQVGAARNIDHGTSQRFIQGHSCIAVAANAGLVAKRLLDRLW